VTAGHLSRISEVCGLPCLKRDLQTGKEYPQCLLEARPGRCVSLHSISTCHCRHREADVTRITTTARSAGCRQPAIGGDACIHACTTQYYAGADTGETSGI